MKPQGGVWCDHAGAGGSVRFPEEAGVLAEGVEASVLGEFVAVFFDGAGELGAEMMDLFEGDLAEIEDGHGVAPWGVRMHKPRTVLRAQNAGAS